MKSPIKLKIEKLKTRIIHEVFLQGSKSELQKVSTKNIANKLKIGEGTIFFHFKTKENLINESITEVEKKLYEHLKICTQTDNLKQDVKNYWIKYLNFYMDNPILLMFTIHYRRSIYYHNVRMNEEKFSSDEYLQILAKCIQQKNHAIVFERDLLNSYLVDSMTNIAFYFYNKKTPITEIDIESSFYLLFEIFFK